jgi:hypothetical protein
MYLLAFGLGFLGSCFFVLVRGDVRWRAPLAALCLISALVATPEVSAEFGGFGSAQQTAYMHEVDFNNSLLLSGASSPTARPAKAKKKPKSVVGEYWPENEPKKP